MNSRKDRINKAYQDYVFPCVFNYYKEPLIIESAKGARVKDIDGREYLDFFGGIVTISVGHCEERVAEKICAQVRKLQHISTLYRNEPMVLLAEKLASIAPGRIRKSFFTSSGTEANEFAILLAQQYTGCQEVIALRHSYSGRSLLAMSLTGHSVWRVGPTQIAGIKHAHNPYCFRCAFGASYPNCDLACARDIEELILTTTQGRIAGFIAESIQGVGGFIVPPPGYFKLAVEIVRKYGGIFISDEVQTGFGRTGGKWWGIQHWDVEPDVITCAKAMGNGIPIAATMATDEVAASIKGLTISTFGGNPVSCVAAKEAIDIIQEKKLYENAKFVGDYLREKLLELQEKYPLIGDVRGMGFMQALELVREKKEPARDETLQFFEETVRRGLLVGKGGLYGNVIRISPPMTITKSDVDEAVGVMDESFAAIYQARCKSRAR